MRKTLQPNICFIGVGPDSGVGSADGANSGGNRGNAFDADFGGRGGYLGQDPNGSGVGVFGTGTHDGKGGGGVLGSNEGTENSAGQQGKLGFAHTTSIAAKRTLSNPTSLLPGMGLANFAIAMAQMAPDGTPGTASEGGGYGSDNASQKKIPAAAQTASALPDPVAPAQQTISAPDSPEQQAAAVQARRKKKSRPLINGGFLGTTAGGVSDTGQTQTPTGPSLGSASTLGPGAGFIRKKNTF